MDCKSALVDACVNLPPLVEAITSTCLQHPGDIVRFRSVCRSWRMSTPPPPYKISSLFFPSPPTLNQFLINFPPYHVDASAVYLLRPHPNSKPWMVSIQESHPGNLLLRHALTYEEIKILDPPPVTYTTNTNNNNNNNNSDKWIATQITRVYAFDGRCWDCNRDDGERKGPFVSSANRQTGELVGLCGSIAMYFGSKLDLGGKDCAIESAYVNHTFDDAVNFNGRIYAVDKAADIYAFDLKEFKTIRIGSLPLPPLPSKVLSASLERLRFVVSDGDLYVVLRFGKPRPTKCLIYRVVVYDDDIINNVRIPRCMAEEVEDLGESVFFVAKNCSFSVSARDLPRPWRKNCIVVVDDHFISCGCNPTKGGIHVFHLGRSRRRRPQFKPMWSLKGYSELFDPPSSWNFNQVSLQFPTNQFSLQSLLLTEKV